MNDNTVSIGSYTYVKGKNSLGLGVASRVFSDNSLSIGVGSVVTHNAKNSLVFGNSSVAKAKNSLAIGNYSKAELENSISIGNHSNTDYKSEWLEEPGYAPRGAISTVTSKGVGVVSIGTIGRERRLTNLASGYRDTDAVNVAQLRSLEEKLSAVNSDEEDTSMINYLSVDKKNTSGEGYQAKEIALKEAYYKEYVQLKAKELEIKVRKERNQENFKTDYTDKITKRINALEQKGIKAIDDAKTNDYAKYDDAYIKNQTKTVDSILREISESKDKALAKKQTDILSADEIAKLKASNYNNDGATGTDAIALGYGANAKGKQAVAIGKNAEGTGEQSVVIGTSNSSNNAVSDNNDNATDTNKDVTKMTAGTSSVSIGNGVKSDHYAVGIGGNVVAGETAVAIGDRARAIKTTSVAIGSKALANGAKSIAIGNKTQSNAEDSYVFGGESEISNEAGQSSAIGYKVSVKSSQAVAMGNDVLIEKDSRGAVAIGSDDSSYNEGNNKENGSNYTKTKAKGNATTAIGAHAQATDIAATALGARAFATKKETVAVGANSKASVEGAVAIGSYSLANQEKNTTYYNPKTGNTDGRDTNTLATKAAVSIGDANKKVTRQLIGLAAGTNDTDAVNVWQLKELKSYFDEKAKFTVKADMAPHNTSTEKSMSLGNTLEFTGRKFDGTAKFDSWTVKDADTKNGGYTSENVETFVTQDNNTGKTSVLIGLRKDPRFDKVTVGGENKTEITDSGINITKKVTENNNKVDKVVKFGIDDKGNATLTDARNTTASPIVTENTLGDQKISYTANSDTNKKQTSLTTGFDFTSNDLEIKTEDNGKVTFKLSDKVKNSLNGEAGTVVYTDSEGNRLVKANDGKYYKKEFVEDDGKVKANANGQGVENPELRLVDAKGETTKPITLGNVASALGLSKDKKDDKRYNKEVIEKLINKEAKNDLEYTEAELNKVVTLRDLQFLASKGITFAGSTGKATKFLGDTIKINRSTSVTQDSFPTKYETQNIAVKVDDKKGNIEIGLAKELSKINSITSEKDANDNTKTKITLSKDGATFGVEKEVLVGKHTTTEQVGVKTTIDKDGISVTKKGETTPSVSIKESSIEFATKEEGQDPNKKTVGTGSITGLKDLDGNSDGHMATNKNYVDKKVKTTEDTVTGKITALEEKKLGFTGDSGTKVEKKLGEDIAIKGDNNSITTEAGNNAITIKVKDGGITSDKIADKNVTKAKLADDITTDLDKIDNKADKSYVDAGLGDKADKNLSNLTEAGQNKAKDLARTAVEVVADPTDNSGAVKVVKSTANNKDTYTVSVNEAKIKEITGTTNIATDYAKVNASNITTNANKNAWINTLGTNSVRDTIPQDEANNNGKGKLVTESAVKAVKDDLSTKITNLTTGGLKFAGNNTTEIVTVPLGDQLNIKGAGTDTNINNITVADDNIKVEGNKTKKGLTVGLSKNLKNIEDITFKGANGKDGKIGVDGDGNITVTNGIDGANGKNGTTSKVVTENTIGNQTLAYKSNSSTDTDKNKTVTLSKGLDFTNGTNTTAEIGDNGVVKFNLKENLTGVKSITGLEKADGNDGTAAASVDYVKEQIATVTGSTSDLTLKLTTDGATDAGTVKLSEQKLKVTGKDGVNVTIKDQGITVGLEEAYKNKLDKLADAKDGKDGKNGTDANSAGSKGATGKDGLNGKDLTEKVNALRNGEAGTVVYTDPTTGERLVKGNDGKYYRPEQLDEEGNVKADADLANKPAVENPVLSLVNGKDGETTTRTALGNLANGLDGVTNSTTGTAISAEDAQKAINGDAAANPAKPGLLTQKTGLDKAATVGDLQALAQAGLDFDGNSGINGTTIHRTLGSKVMIIGEGTNDIADFASASGNIQVKSDKASNTLTVKLSKDLKNINTISSEAKDGKTTTITLDGKDGMTVKPGEGDTSTNIGKDGIGIKGKDGKDRVSITGKDGGTVEVGKDGNGKAAVTINGKDGKDGKIEFAKDGDKGTGTITGLKDPEKNADGTLKDPTTAANAGFVDKTVKDAVNGLTGKEMSFTGNDGDTVGRKLGETLTIKGEGTVDKETAADNIKVSGNKTDGSLTIGLAKDLKNIESISSKPKDGKTTTITLDGKDGMTVKPGEGDTSTNIGKDGVTVESNNTTNDKAKTVIGKDGIGIKGKDGADGISIKGDNGTDGNTIVVKGKDGKDGVSITGKDGGTVEVGKDANGKAAVVINGKDGKEGKIEFAKDANGKGTGTITGLKDPEIDPATGKAKDPTAATTVNYVNNYVDSKLAGVDDKLEAVDRNRPFEYFDKDGNKVVRAKNGKLYKETDVEKGVAKTGAIDIAPSNVVIKAMPTVNNEPLKVTNIAKADLTDKSTDAVNGSQLKSVMDAAGIKTDKNGNIVQPDFNGNKVKNPDGTDGEKPTDIKDAIDKTINTLNKGMAYGSDNVKADLTKPQYLGSSLTIKSADEGKALRKTGNDSNFVGKNIVTEYTKDAKGNGTVTVAISEKPEFKEVTATDKITVGKDAISIKGNDGKDGKDGGPSIEFKKVTEVVKDANGNPVKDKNGKDVVVEKGTGTISGIKDPERNQDGSLKDPTTAANNASVDKVDQKVKDLTDKVNNKNDQMTKQLHHLGKEIDGVRSESRKIGSLGAAMAALNPMEYDPMKPNQVLAGVGSYKNSQAVAVGMSHHFNENLRVQAGVSVSQGRRTESMVNLGLAWKIGKDDRDDSYNKYKEGPISSIYVMQDEMKQVMEENKNLKSEVEEMKKQLQTLIKQK